MKQKNKYLLIAIIGIICLGYIANVKVYKHRITTSSYWKDQSETEIKKLSENIIPDNSAITNASNLKNSIVKKVNVNSNKTMSMHIKFGNSDDEIVFNVNGCDDLKVDFDEDTNIGFGRFIPFFKFTKFRSDFDVKWSCDVIKGNETFNVSKDGSFEIRGKIRLTGFCSAKEVKKIIHKEIAKQAQSLVQEDIKKGIASIENVD